MAISAVSSAKIIHPSATYDNSSFPAVTTVSIRRIKMNGVNQHKAYDYASENSNLDNYSLRQA